MTRSGRRVGWALFTLWCAWLFALTGLVGNVTSLGAWLPDLGVVLLFALGAHLAPGRLAAAAVVVALARIAFSVDPPAAILAGYLGLAGFHAALRSLVNLEELVARACFAGLSTLALTAWLSLVHHTRNPALLDGVGPELAWRAALSTGFAALLLSGALLRLPGLRPLWERRGYGGLG